MGTVFLAERADGQFEKQVAIKILNRGADTAEILRRFRAERQILARLDHPNIARLLDAGTTNDGLPYFIMDYIVGAPVTRFAVAQRLPTRQRLELFLKICAAVEFAHRNLVVHRDIKPSNILANAEGEPKLLDFGIAKLLAKDEDAAQLTTEAQQHLTPICASPEQAKWFSLSGVRGGRDCAGRSSVRVLGSVSTKRWRDGGHGGTRWQRVSRGYPEKYRNPALRKPG